MSEDLRIKKLRGSGGFVIAQVTDEQQSKGNLGGPDLFLAPIGRLDIESIKKYTCNTCDKEYEGSPKIEYENPNEEVAENLILAERGQYLCTTCGSPIAEYREFKKPNELAEIGNANPVEVQTEIAQEALNEVQQQSDDQYHAFDDFGETVPEVDPVDTTFNAISGMSVFDENAKQIGIAKQVGVDSNNQVILVVSDNNGNDVSINWQRIKKVGEVVLLGDSLDTTTSASTQLGSIVSNPGLRCPSCNFDNRPDSKFCESCGNKF
jgi:sporulation protein YlmC with PRC-barrel domain/DNA-directed RNA polymerase subunit RPC12/RpoP